MNLILLMAMMLFQTQPYHPGCGYEFADTTKTLSNADMARVTKAADELSAIGALPRVFILGPVTNIDQTEDEIEKACGDWQGPNGKRKTTLVALLYSPESHKFGVYSGTAFHAALGNGQWIRIATQYGKPHFAAGETADGFVAVIDAVKRRITESERESMGNTTVNEATDYSGLWAAFKFFLLVVLIVGFVFFVAWVVIRRGRARREHDKAQADAINAKIEASNLLAANKDRPDFDESFRRFRDLSNRVATDPYEKTYTTEEYRSIEKQYQNLSASVREILSNARWKEPEAEPTQAASPAPTAPVVMPKGETIGGYKSYRHSVNADAAPVIHEYEPTTYVPTPVIPIPIVLPIPEPDPDYGREERENRREREEDERESRNSAREEKEDESSGSVDTSDNDDSNDGGSVDTSSSDSSSDSSSSDSSSSDGGSIDV